jgi:hypothetical protein
MSPKTVFEDKEKLESVVIENLLRVKQMVRKLSSATIGDMDAIQTVDEELSSWINNGWKLFATHYVGFEVESYRILYILTKD